MSAEFSAETRLCNWLRSLLEAEAHSIVQLIPPSGQATFSITYFCAIEKRKKTVFPDLISVHKSIIFIGEVKEFFSEEDREKLLRIERSEHGVSKIKNLVGRIKKMTTDDFSVKFILIHGDSKAKTTNDISQMILLSPEEFIMR